MPTGTVREQPAVLDRRSAIVPGQAVRVAVAVVVLGMAVIRALRWYRRALADGGAAFAHADWLINYGGGFVRRGLIGEIALRLTPPGNSALYAIGLIQLACYFLLIGYLWRYLDQTGFSWHALALVLSPAAVPFIGWDTLGGFRKEILGFAVLVVLAVAGPAGGRARVILRAVALVGYALAVLSWEPAIFLLPAVGYLLRDQSGPPGADRPRQSWPWTVGFVVVVITGAIGAVLAPGAGATAPVCARIRDHGLDGGSLCAGAVAMLGSDSAAIRSDLWSMRADYPGYLVIAMLCLLPILSHGFARRNRTWMAAIIVGILPLFLIATDWGRWLHILVITLTICLAADAMSSGRRQTTGPADESPQWTAVACLLFIGLWYVPHSLGALSEGWRWGGLIAQVLQLLTHHVGGM